MEDVIITGFKPEFATDFARLNYEWIAKYYGVEKHDRELLDNPVESVIDPGGEIFFAVDRGRVVGTVALIPMGNSTLELAKMAVDPESRGRGIGDKLMLACIDHARTAGAHSLILESNTKQAAAIELYRKHGFVEIPLDPNSHFVRANIRMRLDLSGR